MNGKLGDAIRAAHDAFDTEHRNALIRVAIRHGATIRQIAGLLGVSVSTVYGWVGRRDRIIGNPLDLDVRTLCLEEAA